MKKIIIGLFVLTCAGTAQANIITGDGDGTPGGLLGDMITVGCPNIGECGNAADVDVTVVDPGQEIAGNGSNDGSIAGFLFVGEFIDFLDTSLNVNITGQLNATLRVTGIDDILQAAVEAADPNGIIQSVTFIDANSFEFRILAGVAGGLASIDLTFADNPGGGGGDPYPVPEPSALLLLVLGLGSTLLLRKKA